MYTKTMKRFKKYICLITFVSVDNFTSMGDEAGNEVSLSELIVTGQIVLPAEHLPPDNSQHLVGSTDSTSVVVYVQSEFVSLPLWDSTNAPWRLFANAVNKFDKERPRRSLVMSNIDWDKRRSHLREYFASVSTFAPPNNEYVSIITLDGVTNSGVFSVFAGDNVYLKVDGRRSLLKLGRDDMSTESRSLIFRDDHVESLVNKQLAVEQEVANMLFDKERNYWLGKYYSDAPKVELIPTAGGIGDELFFVPASVYLPYNADLSFHDRINVSLVRGKKITGALSFSADGSVSSFVFPNPRGLFEVDYNLSAFVESDAEWRDLQLFEANMLAAKEQAKEAAARARAVEEASRIQREAAEREQRRIAHEMRMAEIARAEAAENQRLALKAAEAARDAAEEAAENNEAFQKEMLELQKRQAVAAEDAAYETRKIRRAQEEEKRKHEEEKWKKRYSY